VKKHFPGSGEVGRYSLSQEGDSALTSRGNSTRHSPQATAQHYKPEGAKIKPERVDNIRLHGREPRREAAAGGPQGQAAGPVGGGPAHSASSSCCDTFLSRTNFILRNCTPSHGSFPHRHQLELSLLSRDLD
jgi:hypothetical protein